MSQWRYLGWAFLALAFFAAAAESAAHAMAREAGIMATSQVLRILAPEAYVAIRSAVDTVLHPAVWDYVFRPVLALPGWLLFGLPGALLAWRFRPTSEAAYAEEDYPVSSYEDIVAAAEEADEWDTGLPSKYRDLDEYDPTRPPHDDAASEMLPEDAAAEERGERRRLGGMSQNEFDESDVVPSSRFLPPDGGRR